MNFDMKKIKQLKKLIQKSEKILILSHLNPDPDASTSMLLVKEYINQLFPGKNISMFSKASSRIKIPKMEEIETMGTFEGEFDLIICTDANRLDRCVEEIDPLFNTKTDLFFMDHHLTDSVPENVIYMDCSSSAEIVVRVFEKMGGKITDIISELAQIGILTDTGRFLYDNTKPETFELMSRLRRIYSFNIDEFYYKMEKFPEEALIPLSIFLKNFKIEGSLGYTYISKEDVRDLEIKSFGLASAYEIIKDKYIRYVQGSSWGFVIKPLAENRWKVSFRSNNGIKDVKILAEQLGGGGHESSSSCIVEGNDIEEVVNKILEII